MVFENKSGVYVPVKKIYDSSNGVKRVINKRYEKIKSIANEVFFYSEPYDLLKLIYSKRPVIHKPSRTQNITEAKWNMDFRDSTYYIFTFNGANGIDVTDIIKKNKYNRFKFTVTDTTKTTSPNGHFAFCFWSDLSDVVSRNVFNWQSGTGAEINLNLWTAGTTYTLDISSVLNYSKIYFKSRTGYANPAVATVGITNMFLYKE